MTLIVYYDRRKLNVKIKREREDELTVISNMREKAHHKNNEYSAQKIIIT